MLSFIPVILEMSMVTFQLFSLSDRSCSIPTVTAVTANENLERDIVHVAADYMYPNFYFLVIRADYTVHFADKLPEVCKGVSPFGLAGLAWQHGACS